MTETKTGHQAFVHLPSQDKVLRTSITQKDNTYLGSDLTYDDYERCRVEDDEVSRLPDSAAQGPEIYVLE